MTSTVASGRVARHDEYVAFINKTCLIPGSRAALRSGLGRRPEHAHRMHAFVADWVHEDVHPDQEWAHYTVAALIAAQPPAARKTETSAEDANDEAAPEPAEAEAKDAAETDKQQRRLNLGHSLAEAVNREDAKRRTMEKRLQLLARQSVDGVHTQLSPLVGYLRNKKVPVDWSRLLEDLRRWPYDRDKVAKEWLQAYFRTLIDPDFEADDEGPDNADDTDEADTDDSDNEE